MKRVYIFVLIGFLGCKNQTIPTEKRTEKSSHNNSDSFGNKFKSNYYILSDTVRIATEIGDTLVFGKNEFNEIIETHPEFFHDLTYNPDYLYYQYGNNKTFGSEVGQDVYYILYAYFLKQKNGEVEFREQRKKLIDIYTQINILFGSFQYSGTYFGHQRKRILGYAEYSVYLYPKSGEKFEKTYNIIPQKELYIRSLRQQIKDESSIDFQSLGNDKIESNQYLNKIVDEIDRLITDIFYFRSAQLFQYNNYMYF